MTTASNAGGVAVARCVDEATYRTKAAGRQGDPTPRAPRRKREFCCRVPQRRICGHGALCPLLTLGRNDSATVTVPAKDATETVRPRTFRDSISREDQTTCNSQCSGSRPQIPYRNESKTGRGITTSISS